MGAIISECGTYRYRLERKGAKHGKGVTLILMINPSTADAKLDDATIRKLKGFRDRYGWGRLIVGNLFALRSTDIKVLGAASNPIGPHNDVYLAQMILEAERVIVAWGALAKLPPALRERWRPVVAMLFAAGHRPLSLGAPGKDGHPRHPVMLGYDNAPQPWADRDTLELMQ